jgi:hypothetical protein
MLDITAAAARAAITLLNHVIGLGPQFAPSLRQQQKLFLDPERAHVSDAAADVR